MALRSAALAACCALAAGVAACADPAPPPRVVLVLVDTLRRDALGCYGGPATPAIDALADAGTRFDQAISASGWTLPAVASLLTGTWPAVHKALGKGTRLTPISPDVVTVPELLAGAGVTSAAVANAAFLSPLLGLDRGFAVFDHRHAFNVDVRRADVSVASAVELLDRFRDEPLFLLVHLFDAHLDYDPPAGTFQAPASASELTTPLSMKTCRELGGPNGRPEPADLAFVRAAYDAEVAAVDRAVGQLVAALRERGLYEGTTVVLTSDHGEEFWDHGGFEHGHTLYDELVRVPLLVKPAAGVLSRLPAAIDLPVRTLDLAPTVLELFGVPAPEQCVGSSLVPLLAGRAFDPRPALCEGTLYGAERRALRDERYKYVVTFDADGGVARQELYDWRLDPGETRDLTATRPELVEERAGVFATLVARVAELASRTRAGEERNMGPQAIEEYLESLRSLGYVGREEDEE